MHISTVIAFNFNDALSQFEQLGASTVGLGAFIVALGIGMSIVWAVLDKF